MNTPKTVDQILKPYHNHNCHSQQAWIKGMTEPFPCDCSINEAITALNELIRNERIDELEIQPLFSDKVEQAEYENNRIAELRAEERLQK